MIVAKFKVLSLHLAGGLRKKTTKNLCQDSRSLDRDLNPGPLEYEAEVRDEYVGRTKVRLLP
jgi:hypothetical protein